MIRFLLLGVVFAFTSCGGRSGALSPLSLDSAPLSDGKISVDSKSSDQQPIKDIALLPDSTRSDFRIPDGNPYMCKSGQVYLLSECLAMNKIAVCGAPPGPSCKMPGQPCADSDSFCDKAAAASQPYSSILLAFCIPPEPTFVGPLGISPSGGLAGKSASLIIRGAHFEFGAQYYLVRIDGKQYIADPRPDRCILEVRESFNPPRPGVYPVEVSQYGGLKSIFMKD